MRKATLSFVMSVCHQSRMENSAPIGGIFMKFYTWVFFENLPRKYKQVSLKSDTNDGYFMWRPMFIFDHILLSWMMFQTKVVEKIKTHVLCSVTFFPRKSCRLWDNANKYIVEAERPQVTIWRMRVSSWIPKATSTHSEYVILTACLLKQWLHERAQVLRFAYVACPACSACSV